MKSIKRLWLQPNDNARRAGFGGNHCIGDGMDQKHDWIIGGVHNPLELPIAARYSMLYGVSE